MTKVSELDTPAVTILLDRLQANIGRAQAMIAARGMGNRPHIKTHKIPEIGKKQIAAGAIGITCQKLGEVEVFIDAGVTDDILVTFNIVGEKKTDRLMELSQRVKRLAVVCDNDVVLRGLSGAGVRHGRDVPVLIECDTGFGRNGVQTPQAARELAQMATNLPRVRFEGLMTFPNKAPDTAIFMSEALRLLETDGIPIASPSARLCSPMPSAISPAVRYAPPAPSLRSLPTPSIRSGAPRRPSVTRPIPWKAGATAADISIASASASTPRKTRSPTVNARKKWIQRSPTPERKGSQRSPRKTGITPT